MACRANLVVSLKLPLLSGSFCLSFKLVKFLHICFCPQLAGESELHLRVPRQKNSMTIKFIIRKCARNILPGLFMDHASSLFPHKEC